MAHPEVTRDYTSGSGADTTSFSFNAPARWAQIYGAGSITLTDCSSASGASVSYTVTGGEVIPGEWQAFTSTTCSRVRLGTSWPPPAAASLAVAPVNLAGGNASVTGLLPATNSQDWADAGTIYVAAFTPIVQTMHGFNYQSTGNINFPKITAAIAGQKIALFNLGTGATAVTLVPSGTDSMGVVANGVTAATAAAPGSLNSQTYTANFTQGSWIPKL